MLLGFEMGDTVVAMAGPRTVAEEGPMCAYACECGLRPNSGGWLLLTEECMLSVPWKVAQRMTGKVTPVNISTSATPLAPA